MQNNISTLLPAGLICIQHGRHSFYLSKLHPTSARTNDKMLIISARAWRDVRSPTERASKCVNIVILQITAVRFDELCLTETVVLGWCKPPVILKFQPVPLYNSIEETFNEHRLSQRPDSSSNNIKSCPKEERLNTQVQANYYEAESEIVQCILT